MPRPESAARVRKRCAGDGIFSASSGDCICIDRPYLPAKGWSISRKSTDDAALFAV